MRASLDCLVCLLRQSLEASRYATEDVELHEQIAERVLRLILEYGVHCDAPRIGTQIHRLVREATQCPDPYRKQKLLYNNRALERYDASLRAVQNSNDPLETAVKLAIAGNSIDYAIADLNEEIIDAALNQALDQTLNGSMEELREAINDARTILYLTDNAGEIVYDKLLVATLLAAPYQKEIVVATRGLPVMNDATPEDARDVGMTKLVRVIGNGGDGLGTIEEYLSQEFVELFTQSDLVIAKGMANYETLRDPGTIVPKKIAFLFKAKCKYMAQFSDSTLGDLVVRVR
ncbi:MAG: ARMT1-like domain-containing protein [Planctomycetia bacterium]|nr:ARMT1-like domain-containing protein [Planctomycetia bacterium]